MDSVSAAVSTAIPAAVATAIARIAAAAVVALTRAGAAECTSAFVEGGAVRGRRFAIENPNVGNSRGVDGGDCIRAFTQAAPGRAAVKPEDPAVESDDQDDGQKKQENAVDVAHGVEARTTTARSLRAFVTGQRPCSFPAAAHDSFLPE